MVLDKVYAIVDEYSLLCPYCGKRMTTKGNEYNQVLLRLFTEYKNKIHAILKHRNQMTLREKLNVVLCTLFFIPAGIWQVAEIIRCIIVKNIKRAKEE